MRKKRGLSRRPLWWVFRSFFAVAAVLLPSTIVTTAHLSLLARRMHVNLLIRTGPPPKKAESPTSRLRFRHC